MKSIDIFPAASRALLLFEAAARRGSFSGAASEVGVGQPAVSHAVRQLEEALGVQLFHRQHRGVALTDTGARLAEQVSAGFTQIRQALEEARCNAGAGERVTLLVSTSLATYWLMPRIARFKVAHPAIDLRCITEDTDGDIRMGDFDLCIPLGRGPWPGHRRWEFCEEEIYPVCSAEFLSRAGSIETPGQLLRQPLLHLEERYATRCTWPVWLAHFGVTGIGRLQGPTFNDYSIVIQSALEGHGIALGWRHIVEPLIDQGLLVRPMSDSMRTHEPFFILSPEHRALTEQAKVLREWLVSEASAPAAAVEIVNSEIHHSA